MSPSLLPTPWQSPWSGDHPAQWWPRAPRGATWSCPRWARAPWRSPGFPGVAGGLCTARTRSRSCQAWVRATPWPESGQDNLTSSLTAILCYSLWWTPVSQRFSGWSPSRLWKTEKRNTICQKVLLGERKADLRTWNFNMLQLTEESRLAWPQRVNHTVGTLLLNDQGPYRKLVNVNVHFASPMVSSPP